MRLCYLASALVLIAGCGGSSGPPVNVAGTFEHTLTIDDLNRELIVYVPDAAAGEEPVPVVFVFHGTAQSGQEFYDKPGWRDQADLNGFIVVYPTSLVYCYVTDRNGDGRFADNERELKTKWAEGWLGDPEITPLCSQDTVESLDSTEREPVDHPLADDIAFTDAMLDLMSARYAVDPHRIYATGFSNGGAFVQRLVVERSNVFAAFAAHAAWLAVDAAPAARPASVVLTVGNEDPKVFTRTAPVPMNEQVMAADFLGVRMVQPLLTTLQLDPAYDFTDETLGTVPAIRWRFSDSLVGASNHLDVYLIEGLMHGYPDYLAPAYWSFFEQNSLP